MVNANDTFPTYSKCRISNSYSHDAAGSIGRPGRAPKCGPIRRGPALRVRAQAAYAADLVFRIRLAG